MYRPLQDKWIRVFRPLRNYKIKCRVSPFTRKVFQNLMNGTINKSGLGSSVGMATDYGLDGPGSNPGEDENFRSSRPTLEPTQPPVKRVLCLSRG